MNKFPIGFLKYFSLIFGGFYPPFWLHFVVEFPYKNALQISSIFALIFGCILAPFWLTKSIPKWIQATPGAQKAPRSVPGSLRTLKRHAKWSLNWALDPQNPPSGQRFHSQNAPKMDPGHPWCTWNHQKHAQEPLRPQMTTSMEPKLNSMYVFINCRLELYSYICLCLPHAFLSQDR